MVYWTRRRDLSAREIDAITEYMRAGTAINAFLRESVELPPDYRTEMRTFVKTLDSVIYKSRIDRESIEMLGKLQGRERPHLYRGISGPYARKVLGAVQGGQDTIGDPGYPSFTGNLRTILDRLQSTAEKDAILFCTPCTSGETALFVGGEEFEVLYPRDTRWRILASEALPGRTIPCIYLSREAS